MIVTLPEETPVNESLEMAGELRAEVGVALLPTVVNGCWPDRPGLQRTPVAAAREQSHRLSRAAAAALRTASDFGGVRLDRQRTQIDRLRAELGEVIALPRLPTARLTVHDLTLLADELVGTT